MPQRGSDAGLVRGAVGLTAVWVVVWVALHARLATAWLNPGRDDLAGFEFLFLGLAGVTFVAFPALAAGLVAVSETRKPGTSRRLWWAARLAFWTATGGPAEVAGLVCLWLVRWALRS